MGSRHGKKAFMKATNRLHWLAIAPMAAVLALASQLALAHDGHHHQQEAAPAAAGYAPEAVTAGRATERPAEAAWSPSCPDDSGGECCCKHQPSTTAPHQAAVVNFGGWTRPASRISAPPASRPVEPLPRQPAVSRALPRAPPLFS
jgi:hypothetical protein